MKVLGYTTADGVRGSTSTPSGEGNYIFEPTGYFYLYLYPIIASILAGIHFWVIFSFLPDRNRKREFGVGITNDLISLNNSLFGYFDSFLRTVPHSPSEFQDKIHSCSISEEEFNILLQNKILNESYNIYPQFSERMIVLGEEIARDREKINEIIKRLYAFNAFLSPRLVALLRRIQEKLFRYSFDSEATTITGNVQYQIVDPSLSYMTKVLMELQEDFKELRSEVFKGKILERNFNISKIQFLFNCSRHLECLRLCNKWIVAFPFDSDLQQAYKVRCLLSLGRKNEGYKTLEELLGKNSDPVSQRNLLYPILSDSTVAGIIHRKIEKSNLDRMKSVCFDEELRKKLLLASNAELKTFYASRKP